MEWIRTRSAENYEYRSINISCLFSLENKKQEIVKLDKRATFILATLARLKSDSKVQPIISAPPISCSFLLFFLIDLKERQLEVSENSLQSLPPVRFFVIHLSYTSTVLEDVVLLLR